MFMEITGGVAPISTSADALELKVCNIQNLVIQARTTEVFMATSQAALDNESTRIKIAKWADVGPQSSGLEMSFPHTPLTTTLFFRSALGAEAEVVLLYSTANPGMY